jgi:hypothetical protein
MLSHQYRFVTRWRVEGTPEEVYRLIDDTAEFVRWWPAVWLKVEVLAPGDREGVGKVVRVLSKGWLPYLLRWTARTVEKDFPHRLVLHASGDFEGEGCWSFKADGPQVDVEYLWVIEANKLLLRYLSFLLRPLFAANHDWAMARGEESLRLELARRHARNGEELARVAAPPPPTFLSQGRRRRLGLPVSNAGHVGTAPVAAPDRGG